MVMVYEYAKGAVVGKTGKTAVLPGFWGINKGGGLAPVEDTIIMRVLHSLNSQRRLPYAT